MLVDEFREIMLKLLPSEFLTNYYLNLEKSKITDDDRIKEMTYSIICRSYGDSIFRYLEFTNPDKPTLLQFMKDNINNILDVCNTICSIKNEFTNKGHAVIFSDNTLAYSSFMPGRISIILPIKFISEQSLNGSIDSVKNIFNFIEFVGSNIEFVQDNPLYLADVGKSFALSIMYSGKTYILVADRFIDKATLSFVDKNSELYSSLTAKAELLGFSLQV